MIDYRRNNIWSVYVHIIPKSITKYDFDKYYVGITSRKPEIRWKNGYGYYTQSYFYNAIKKYGWNNIEHYIIAENATQEEACKLEAILIKKLESNNKKYGYNLTNGGDGVDGYVFSEEQLNKMSENQKGNKNSFYGKKHTEETKLKMKNNHYDCNGSNNPNAKAIYRFDLDYNFIEKYPSSTDADKILGCNFSGSAALNGSLCANSYWAREDNIIIDENGIHMKNPPLFKGKKDIFQFDKDWLYIGRYISGGQASNITGLSASNINRSAREKIMGNGYYWLHRDDIEFIDSIPFVKDSVKNEITNNMKAKQNNFVPVVNITTKECFSSFALAASIYNVKYTNIRIAAIELAKGHKRKCGGYEWLLYSDYLKINNLTDDEARKSLIFI